ncbi:MAG TPA: methyltransferase [Acidimicrobiales bacterium]
MTTSPSRRRALAAVGTSVFFAVAPGVVAGVVPWLLTGWHPAEPLPHWAPVRAAGAVVLVVATVVLVQAFVRFVVEGLGTPSPAAPTERLVVGGLYRYVRNPMYLAVAAAIVGQALLLGRPALLLYAAAVTALNAAFVHTYEEPALRRRFGADYDAYRTAVPAWWPRRHPWVGRSGGAAASSSS